MKHNNAAKTQLDINRALRSKDFIESVIEISLNCYNWSLR